ncbi:MAG: 5'/3'-nucleotidase SurE [Acidimicrobiia bacterium]
MSATRPRARVLVTNDDGVASPGIRVLARALHAAGHDVRVVAPATDLSGAGASIGPLHRGEPIPVSERHWPELPDVPVLAIERPPATAVYLACIGGFGEKPDVVASGITPGANTGHLVLHSGTVGAALTAAGLGVPALAVSMRWSEDGEYHWETAASLAVPALGWALEARDEDTGTRVLNLNVPNRPIQELRGVRDAALAPYGEFWVASADLRDGDLRMEFRGKTDDFDPSTDEALLTEGYATVTPLHGIVASPLKGAADAVDKRWRRRNPAEPNPVS